MVPHVPPVMTDRHRALSLALGPQPGQDIGIMDNENCGVVLEVVFAGVGAQKTVGFLAREVLGPAQMFISVSKAITTPAGLIAMLHECS